MKLKPTMKGIKKLQLEEVKEEPKKKNKRENKLPSDEYRPLFDPVRFLVKETPSMKDGSLTRLFIELSVKRFGGDIENAPTVFMQMYQESSFYTGYLKGKSVYFPLEMLDTVIEYLEDFGEECDAKNVY